MCIYLYWAFFIKIYKNGSLLTIFYWFFIIWLAVLFPPSFFEGRWYFSLKIYRDFWLLISDMLSVQITEEFWIFLVFLKHFVKLVFLIYITTCLWCHEHWNRSILCCFSVTVASVELAIKCDLEQMIFHPEDVISSVGNFIIASMLSIFVRSRTLVLLTKLLQWMLKMM